MEMDTNDYIQIAEFHKSFKVDPPKTCYTCAYYWQEHCKKHDAKPPSNFKKEKDLCQEWTIDMPF